MFEQVDEKQGGVPWVLIAGVGAAVGLGYAFYAMVT